MTILHMMAFAGGFLLGMFGVLFAREREWQMATLCAVLFVFMEAMLVMLV